MFVCCGQSNIVGKRLHIDPILCSALFLLPSLHSIPALNDLDKGDIGLRVEHPLEGAGSAGALDYAVLYLKVSQDAGFAMRLHPAH